MTTAHAAAPLRARASTGLAGRIRIPGDKSISHRALILGAMAVGETVVTGLLEGEDVLRTGAAMAALGAEVTRGDDGVWRIHGVGVGGFAEPGGVLDFGNSGTGVRLAMGAVSTTPIACTFTGDASLCRRPMSRVLDPLGRFGAESMGRAGGRLPLTLRGSANPMPVTYVSPVASAQVKSAILLAGLNAPGRTTVVEREATRDHTERMLRAFGASVSVETHDEGHAVSVEGGADLRAISIAVPGDPSSAAFPLAAALLVPDSDVTVEGVLMNPTRAGLFETLREMGASLDIIDRRDEGGEPIAALRARFSALKGIEVPPERAPSMIDEYPILAVLASFAEGRTVMRGLKELRVKESDRIAAMARGLAACGVKVTELDDGLIVEGNGPGGMPGGATIATEMDHRIAMSFLVAGLAAKTPVTVDDSAFIATSFPGFTELMTGLGGGLVRVNR
ncbi:3-phosphoshikimate 1-carboxyvinyltransferase [Alphaproteobacteria bacterium SO-S41]|nr:3-phosphoshikimate 1-carboxyvinyltransferase [Alphaproteobacteria bacterium SO-S41]